MPQVVRSGLQGDFAMPLRQVCCFKLMHYLFQEDSVRYFQTMVDHKENESLNAIVYQEKEGKVLCVHKYDLFPTARQVIRGGKLCDNPTFYQGLLRIFQTSCIEQGCVLLL